MEYLGSGTLKSYHVSDSKATSIRRSTDRERRNTHCQAPRGTRSVEPAKRDTVREWDSGSTAHSE